MGSGIAVTRNVRSRIFETVVTLCACVPVVARLFLQIETGAFFVGLSNLENHIRSE